jgi:hypothetical protein
MRKFLSLIFVSLSLICCKSKEVPKTVIQPKQMEKILYDIHLADSYITSIGNVDSAKNLSAAFYKGIYKKHKIDSAHYNRSMDYYYNHPAYLTDIYEQVKKDLEKTKVKQEKISAKPAAKI